jgi:hypothetical protein
MQPLGMVCSRGWGYGLGVEQEVAMQSYEYRGYTLVVAKRVMIHQGDAFGPLVHTADNLDDAMRFVNDAVKNAIAARAA